MSETELKREIRVSNQKIEIRAAQSEDEPTKIIGYAAVFYKSDDKGTEYRIADDFVERIAPGAFTSAIASDDVRALFNHDVNMLLGRNTSGTLKLQEDSRGLRYEIDIPDTQLGKDILKLAERGDLSGSSFSFIPIKQSYEDNDGLVIRTVEEVQLFDVGPVTFPAYEATTAEARSQVQKIKEKHRARQMIYRQAIARLAIDKIEAGI